MSETNKQPRCGVEGESVKQVRFNAEQLTEYLNMEARYKDMTERFKALTAEPTLTDTDYEDICRRYAQATLQMVKLRSFVRGPMV